jgi:ribosomal protein S12 methylthiotransferase
LRTTCIVGFPGETEREFKELLEYIKEVRFDKLGAFIYSREKGTPAYHFSGQISPEVKKQRLDTLMSIQQKISKKKNQTYLGKIKEVLIDEIVENKNEKWPVIGRTMTEAPEIDGKVFIDSKKAKVGEFVNVKIIDSSEYDLYGELL